MIFSVLIGLVPQSGKMKCIRSVLTDYAKVQDGPILLARNFPYFARKHSLYWPSFIDQLFGLYHKLRKQQQLYLYPTMIYMIQKTLDKIWREYRLPIITIEG